jgi:hypothetical protein
MRKVAAALGRLRGFDGPFSAQSSRSDWVRCPKNGTADWEGPTIQKKSTFSLEAPWLFNKENRERSIGKNEGAVFKQIPHRCSAKKSAIVKKWPF